MYCTQSESPDSSHRSPLFRERLMKFTQKTESKEKLSVAKHLVPSAIRKKASYRGKRISIIHSQAREQRLKATFCLTAGIPPAVMKPPRCCNPCRLCTRIRITHNVFREECSIRKSISDQYIGGRALYICAEQRFSTCRNAGTLIAHESVAEKQSKNQKRSRG